MFSFSPLPPVCVFRPQYFKLIDKCVSQIVLHKTGLDPDFHYTQKFQLDVDAIIGKINSTRLHYTLMYSVIL